LTGHCIRSDGNISSPANFYIQIDKDMPLLAVLGQIKTPHNVVPNPAVGTIGLSMFEDEWNRVEILRVINVNDNSRVHIIIIVFRIAFCFVSSTLAILSNTTRIRCTRWMNRIENLSIWHRVVFRVLSMDPNRGLRAIGRMPNVRCSCNYSMQTPIVNSTLSANIRMVSTYVSSTTIMATRWLKQLRYT
jgi:hypothetical protein